MRFWITVLAVVLISTVAKADLFTQRPVPVGKATTQESVHDQSEQNQKNSAVEKYIQAEKAEENVIRKFVGNYKTEHSQYFQSATPCECESCNDNKVYFYFLESSFTKQDIDHAIQLAKDHGLYPVVNIETDKPCSTESCYIQEFRKIEDKIPDTTGADVSLEHDLNAIEEIKKHGGKCYFRFDSINGLRVGGKIENFNRIYHIAFGE